jgi:cholesterol oxidase
MTSVPLQVREWMKGYLGFGATDHDAGFTQGMEQDTYFMHELLIRIDDVDRFVKEPDHGATMDGYIACDALGGRRPVEGARFNMFVDTKVAGLKHMLYRVHFLDGEGQPATMLGHKTVHDDRSLDLWSDTTTLYTRIFAGHLPDGVEPVGPPRAMGMLHIEKLDLFKSLLSFRSPGASLVEANHAKNAFGQFFLGQLWEVYGRRARVGV